MWKLLSLTAIAAVASSDEAYQRSRSPRIPNPSEREISDAFRLFMIVPQIIPVAPKAVVSKIFSFHYANLGNRIPPCDTRVSPFTWYPNDPYSLYTFIGIDPDHPQFFNTDGSQLLIELQVNIPGVNFVAGTVVSPFLPIAPVPNTGDHRYIFLVYKQPRRISITTELIISKSTNFYNFSISEFVDQYGLGNPVAGNFFRARQSVCESPACSEEICC